MSDSDVAPLETAFGVDHHVSRATAPENPVRLEQDGGPEMVQLLTPEGERVSHPEHDAVVDALSDEELRGFYRDLVLIRRFDAEATALQRQGELGLWASLLGQEAAQVGSGRALRRMGGLGGGLCLRHGRRRDLPGVGIGDAEIAAEGGDAETEAE